MMRAWDRLVDALALIAALILGAMALHIGYDVAARYLFASPTDWSNDLSEYSLLWATFLAAPWLVRTGGHVRIDILTERLPARPNHVLAIVVALAGAAVCVVAAWQTGVETFDYWRRGTIFAKVWAVPQWIVYVAMPVGFVAMAVEFLRNAVRGPSVAPSNGNA